jgi:hypothetical protein
VILVVNLWLNRIEKKSDPARTVVTDFTATGKVDKEHGHHRILREDGSFDYVLKINMLFEKSRPDNKRIMAIIN